MQLRVTEVSSLIMYSITEFYFSYLYSFSILSDGRSASYVRQITCLFNGKERCGKRRPVFPLVVKQILILATHTTAVNRSFCQIDSNLYERRKTCDIVGSSWWVLPGVWGLIRRRRDWSHSHHLPWLSSGPITCSSHVPAHPHPVKPKFLT